MEIRLRKDFTSFYIYTGFFMEVQLTTEKCFYKGFNLLNLYNYSEQRVS